MTAIKEIHAPLFLAELRANGGFVSKACEQVDVSKQTAYNWRKADEVFASEWDKAVELATEDLEKEARRRALHGVDEPVFYKGEVVGAVRKFSDTLLMFTIKARKPEYRDKIQVDVKQLDSDIERELAIIAARSQGNSSSETAPESIN